MATWFFEVIEYCNFNRIIAQISISYLDRFLGTEEGFYALCDKRDYQLTAMCCLLLAVKIHQPVKLEMKLLSKISHGVYSALEFKSKEKEILELLKWRLCTPTATCFASCYFDLLPKKLPSAMKENIQFLSNWQIENCVKDYFFASKKPSLIALSSILNAIDLLKCTNTFHNQSFHRDLILCGGIPSDVNVIEIQEKISNRIEDLVPSIGKKF